MNQKISHLESSAEAIKKYFSSSTVQVWYSTPYLDKNIMMSGDWLIPLRDRLHHFFICKSKNFENKNT